MESVLPTLDSQDLQDFFADCGGLPPQVIVEGRTVQDSRVHVLQRPFALVGRSRQCDIRLVHGTVSLRHAYLQLIQGRLAAVDLGSRTGVHWPDGRRRVHWIDPGQKVWLGPYSLRRSYDDQRRGQLAGTAAAWKRREDLPDVYLELLNHRGKSRNRVRTVIRRNLTLIGSSDVCKITLADDSVSDIHCSVVLTDNGAWVVDLRGRDVTRVDGAPISFCRLVDGSELTVGKFRFVVRYGIPEEVTDSRAVAAPGSDLTAAPRSMSRVSPVLDQLAEFSRLGNFDLSNIMELVPTGGRGLSRNSTSELSESTGQGVSEQLVATLVAQFASMQQHLFQQSAQMMQLLTQTLTSAHQAQMKLVQDDMQRVHAINDELRDIQKQLLLEGRPKSAIAEAPARRRNIGQEKVPGQQASSLKTGPPRSSKGKAAAAETQPSRRSLAAKQKSQSRPLAAATASAGTRPAARAAAEPADAIDMHAWLSVRIRELERERTSRWQKIMGVLARSGLTAEPGPAEA